VPDTSARPLARKLWSRIGQSVVVENRLNVGPSPLAIP
jgi:hypothetical protein